MAYAAPVLAVNTNANINVGIGGPGTGSWDGIAYNDARMVSGTTRLLLVHQTMTPSENGVWIWHGAANPLQRPAVGDQYAHLNVFDNATLVPVSQGTTYAGTVWGIDPATVVTVDTTAHTLTRVSLPPVQARCMTTGAAGTIFDVTVHLYATIDGVTLNGNGGPGSDIVLVTDQGSLSPPQAQNNGLYWANTAGAGGPMVRCSEPIVEGRAVVVTEGAWRAQMRYELVTQGPIVLGTTALKFAPLNLVYDVRAYGAVPNFDGITKAPTDDGTNNFNAFNAALAAMYADGLALNRMGKLVADGQFFLSAGLVLTQSILFEGSGASDFDQSLNAAGNAVGRSASGTLLVFPGNVCGIRIYSESPTDNPNVPPTSGEQSVLRNLTLYCKDTGIVRSPTAHGIYSTATISLSNVRVLNFAGDGFRFCGNFIEANGNNNQGNSDFSFIQNCYAGSCLGDGYHFEGGDAWVTVINCCVAQLCGPPPPNAPNAWPSAGFYDASTGNTYICCYANNWGLNYQTVGLGNGSTFLGCTVEGYSNCDLQGQPSLFGSKIDGGSATTNSTGFILAHGVASRAPIGYFNNRGRIGAPVPVGADPAAYAQSLTVQFSVGTQNGSAMEAFQWQTNEYDPLIPGAQVFSDQSTLFYTDAPNPLVQTPAIPGIAHRWWTLQNFDYSYRLVMRFPTNGANARNPAPWFPNGLSLGRDDVLTVGANPAVQPLPMHMAASPIWSAPCHTPNGL
jgi:hypothetical protein